MIEEYAGRVQRVREQAGMRGLEGVVIVGRAPDRNGDMLYLTGHVPMLAGHPSRFAVRGRGLGFLFIPTDPKLAPEVVVTTPFHTPAHGVERITVNPNIVKGITSVLESAGMSGTNIGLVGMDVISAMSYAELLRYCPTIRFVEADDIVMNMRAVKSEREMAALRTGSAIADEVGDIVRKEIVPGVTEAQIAARVREELTKRGVTNAFATCQTGVARSGEPYLVPPVSERVMEDGDLLHMEINGRYEGYMIDICRATIVGKQIEAGVHLLETVNTMLEVSIEAIKPGVLAEDLEKIANDVAVAAGYEANFAFGYGGAGTYLGHGIGLGVDEPPAICKGEKTFLRPGMVLTIEPGLYRTPVGGARIEDEVLVTETGCEVMTKLERRWWAA